jgi:3-deoxy-7-phosphoheptulonate synthase
MTVAFQGEAGAFSDEAAQALFGEAIATRGYASFDALVEAVAQGDVRYGLLPCENTIHGSIARAYDLLYAYENVAIVDETTHRIEQTLVGAHGATLEGIESIASHPVALEQCRAFLAERPAVRVEVHEDTAGAVRAVAERGDPRLAAIGPALAAQRYGGTVLARGIQDEHENYTRFFVISTETSPRRNLGRLVLAFVVPHEPGSLHRALGTIAERGLNLRSLVPRPQRKRPFEYAFFAELDFPQTADAGELTAAISEQTRVLGRY